MSKMRRKHSEVKDKQEIQRILAATNIGRLATMGQDGFPYITPVNFVSYDGKIYFHCSPRGEKIDNLLRNPQVCFEVDVPLSYVNLESHPERSVCKLHQFYHCVIIRGFATIVQENEEKAVSLNRLIQKHENSSTFKHVTPQMPGFAACKVVKISPVSISAKSDLGQNMSEEIRVAIANYFASRKQSVDIETVKAMGYDPHF